MSKLRRLLRTAFIGGLVVILPIAILALFLRWLFGLLTDLIQPGTDLVIRYTGAPEMVGDLMVACLLVVICLLVGSLTMTGIGRYLHSRFDSQLRRVAPGYQMVKEVVTQLVGENEDSLFRAGVVAEVRIFGAMAETSVTAIVTSTHPDDRYTVFVPTGPNPTTGFVFHVPAAAVTLRPDIKVESAIRTIVSCGAGSSQLLSGLGEATAMSGGTDASTGPTPAANKPAS